MVASTTNPPLWLGIDLGTQGARCMALRGDGTVAGYGAADYPAGAEHRAGAVHEQDPQAWWVAVTMATRQALEGLGDVGVGGVAVDSTSGTVVVCDTAGRPVGGALMYDDTRAGVEAVRAFAADPDFWAALGHRPQASWAVAKAIWLGRTGALGSGRRLVHQADFIAARLCGTAVATDVSHALKTGVDPRTGTWPTDVLAAAGVPVDALPEVVASGTVLGSVSARAAGVSGIPARTPVHAGMTDGCAAQIAAGALSPGTWTSALGTTLTIKGSTAEPLRDPAGVVYNHRNPDGGWLPGGASNIGARAVRDGFPGSDPAALTAGADLRRPARERVYPLLGTGERFPFVAALAHGFANGRRGTDSDHFAAVLQGIAYVERLCYQQLAGLGADICAAITITGATAVNEAWNQLRSDVLGRPVEVVRSAHAATGMAILAAAPPGRLGVTAARMVRIGRRFEPDPRVHERHQDAYDDLLDQLRRRGWLSAAGPAPIDPYRAVAAEVL